MLMGAHTSPPFFKEKKEKIGLFETGTLYLSIESKFQHNLECFLLKNVLCI